MPGSWFRARSILLRRDVTKLPAPSAAGIKPRGLPLWLARLLIAVLSSLCCGMLPAHAAVIDEIQAYTDDINKPREFGLELHVNTTPKGRSTPDCPNEFTPRLGLRFTPEFSYGLTRDQEAGLYQHPRQQQTPCGNNFACRTAHTTHSPPPNPRSWPTPSRLP